MFFNSFDFGIFLCLCVAFFFLLQATGHYRAQNRLLLVASYVFYSAWDWRFSFLIAISTLVDYFVARALGREEVASRRKWLVTCSLVVNLGFLGFFKYANFFAAGFHELGLAFGLEISPFVLDVVLPVGISFYTFQTLSYTIDVYRGELSPTTDFFDFALFVSFFPQLVAGPIERARNLLPQIGGPRIPSWERFDSGCWLIFWGLFKKVVIADNLAKMVDFVFAGASNPTGVEIVVATYAFAFQIYCDFSGYTDIARGVARLMGFDLMLNFRLPYLATDPSDFWRRWHISLSTWLRDYLYISLGGNRAGRRRTLQNLLVTMVLGGLWHGAAMPFVIWGAYHGMLLSVHRLTRASLARLTPRGSVQSKLWRALQIVSTFHFVCLGWLIFRSESLGSLVENVLRIFNDFEIGLAGQWVLPMAVLIAPLVLVQFVQARSNDLEAMLRWSLPARIVLYSVLAILMVLWGEDGGQPFIYFQF